MQKQDIVIIILAAGSSSRMGTSKQLVRVDQEPLLRKTVKTAIESEPEGIVVVLGANPEEHRKALEDFNIDVTVNNNWQSGVGSSIKAGVKFIRENYRDSKGVIVLVCDQPLLKADHIKRLIHEQKHSEKSIVASSYAGTVGVPVFFKNEIFPQLLAMDDSEGAKKIILKNKGKMISVDFPGGEIDLDTPEDVRQFTQNI